MENICHETLGEIRVNSTAFIFKENKHMFMENN